MPADPSLLLEVTNLLVTRRDLGELFHALSGCISRAVRHEYASISLFTPGTPGAFVRFVVLDGERREDLEQRAIAVSAGSQAAFDEGRAVVYSIDEFKRNNPPAAEFLVPFGVRSFCSVPLMTARAMIGLLSVASRAEDPFSKDEVFFLQQVSGQIAIAIENVLAYEEIRRLSDQLLSEKQYLEDELRIDHGFDGIIGQSAPLRRVLHEIDTVAPTDSTVLLTGETGTGKELVARAIHARSSRSTRAFVRLNCAAMPAALIESEMFGHERGAFTGAVAARAGRFEVANRGTIFLDEAGDVPLTAQPKLLRVLQEQEFERVGANRPLKVDVRVIAATNRDLPAMVESGEFRRDLFYRLNVFPVRLPPLRERRDDLPMLVRHFVDKHSRRTKRVVSSIPAEVMEALIRWDWPGNIRELENVIERAVILCTDGRLRVPTADFLPHKSARSAKGVDRLAALEKEAIVSALREAGGVVGGAAGAAARLGLKRTTLQLRMKALGIRRPSF